MMDFNITLLIQFVNFVVTLVVLNYLLIRPIRAIVKKRRDLASGLFSDAESFTADADKKLEQYEAALAKARKEAADLREASKNAGLAQQEDLLRAAHAEAQDFLRTSREQTRNAVAETASAMKKRIPGLAEMAATKLLGKKARPSA